MSNTSTSTGPVLSGGGGKGSMTSASMGIPAQPEALPNDADGDGQSDGFPFVANQAGPADRGSMAPLPDPNVLNRGFYPTSGQTPDARNVTSGVSEIGTSSTFSALDGSGERQTPTGQGDQS